MAGVYRLRHPERTVLYRVLFHHFDRFLTEYESRIIDHLKLTFAAERPPPECAFQDLFLVADPPAEYFR